MTNTEALSCLEKRSQRVPPEGKHSVFVRECDDIINSPALSDPRIKSNFPRFYHMLLPNARIDRGFLNGQISGFDENEDHFRVSIHANDQLNVSQISFANADEEMTIDLSSETTQLHHTPTEEGIHARTEELDPEQLREWLSRAMQIYDYSKMSFSDQYRIWINNQEKTGRA